MIKFDYILDPLIFSVILYLLQWFSIAKIFMAVWLNKLAQFNAYCEQKFKITKKYTTIQCADNNKSRDSQKSK